MRRRSPATASSASPSATPFHSRRGFERIEAIIKARGRPLTAFCACELRSPAQFTDAGFRGFNELYVATLARWGIYDAATKVNPVARSNVCPEIGPPAEPSFHAFSFTVAADARMPTFVVAGSGEAREGGASYRERTIRYGETSAAAMREKAVFVLAEMERRLRLLGFSWAHTTATQVYTVHDLHPFLADEIVRRGAAAQRPHLAFLPTAGAGPRVRDGLPGRGGGALRGMTLGR